MLNCHDIPPTLKVGSSKCNSDTITNLTKLT